jgi:hypothetical protein
MSCAAQIMAKLPSKQYTNIIASIAMIVIATAGTGTASIAMKYSFVHCPKDVSPAPIFRSYLHG